MRQTGNFNKYPTFLKVVVVLFAFFTSSIAINSLHAESLIPLIIQKDTSLIKITRTYCTSEYHWKELAKLNKLSPPYRIFPGDTLLVPLELLKVEKLSGRVASVAGSVYLVKNDKRLKKIQKGDTIVPGQTLVTDNDGFAHIVFPDHKYTRVASNSKFSLTYLVNLVDDNLKAEFYLEQGRITHAVKKKLKPNESFQTRTPVSVTGVRGTEFRLKMFGQNKSVVETLSGQVQVDGEGGRAIVNAGLGTIIQKNKQPEKPIALPPTPPAPVLKKLYKVLPIVITTTVADFTTNFRLRIATNYSGTATVLEQTVKSGESFRLLALEDGMHYGFLTAISDKGLESKPSAPFSFEVRTVPGAPIFVSTFKGRSLFDKNVSLSWLSEAKAEKYHIQVSRSADFANVIDKWVQDESTVNLKDLSPGYYHIRVQAIAEDGFKSLYSIVDSWKIEAEPSFDNFSGEGAFDEGLKLEWANTDDDILYDLQISKDKQFSELFVLASGLQEAAYRYSGRLEPGTYYIRIRGVLNDGQVSPWTKPQSILIKPPPFSLLDGAVIAAFLVAIIMI